MKYRQIRPFEITEQDVREVANSLTIGITDDQIKQVIDNYSPEDDPTSTWREVIESLIYNLKD